MNKLKKLLPWTRQRWIRRLIQLFFFIVAPGIYSAAFAGIRYIATQLHQVALLEMPPFLAALLVVCGCTVVLGRFFCGYGCAFGFLGDVIYDVSSLVQKKTKKHLWKMPNSVRKQLMWGKYLVLITIVVLCLFGYYHKVEIFDPWQVVGSLRALNVDFSKGIVGFIVLAAIVVGMVFVERFFCLFLCPLGAVFQLLPVIPWSVIGREADSCINGCQICRNQCPTGYALERREGECVHCLACVSHCLSKKQGAGARLGLDFQRKKFTGGEWWLVILKAAVLYVMIYFLLQK